MPVINKMKKLEEEIINVRNMYGMPTVDAVLGYLRCYATFGNKDLKMWYVSGSQDPPHLMEKLTLEFNDGRVVTLEDWECCY